MKPLGLVRTLLLLLTVFMLLVSTNVAAGVQQAGEGLFNPVAAHASMMMAGTPCDGCPSGMTPAELNAHCSQCLPWLPMALAIPAVLSFTQPLYLSSPSAPVWVQYPALPWKPPRPAVLDA